ncbi:MAG: hypothetical protein K6U04_10275 [Armatimonadetes bacterium]|nr:hypothetical protein [Armatimonadota bacterium]
MAIIGAPSGAGTFFTALNASNLAVPFIGAHFQARMPVAEWVLMAYLLVISTLLLTFGRLGDMYGFRKIYLDLCRRIGILRPGSLDLPVDCLGAGAVSSEPPDPRQHLAGDRPAFGAVRVRQRHLSVTQQQRPAGQRIESSSLVRGTPGDAPAAGPPPAQPPAPGRRETRQKTISLEEE